MLRNILLAIALIAFAGTLIATPFFPAAWPGLLWSGILLLGVAGERFHYLGNERGGSGPWESTGERFRDPETGKRVVVEYNPESGARRYRETP